MNEWWNENTAILIGAIGGPALGIIFGGIGGGLGGYLVSIGTGRTFVLALFAAGITIGILSAAAGAIALAKSQPYHVYYPLLLIGAVLTLVSGIILPVFAIQYKNAERRQLDAKLAR